MGAGRRRACHRPLVHCRHQLNNLYKLLVQATANPGVSRQLSRFLAQLPWQVYQRDVLSRLREGNCQGVDDIEWLRVLRFYQEGEVRTLCWCAIAVCRPGSCSCRHMCTSSSWWERLDTKACCVLTALI